MIMKKPLNNLFAGRINATHCPICHTVPEVIEVAPCRDCGHMRRELEELSRGEHTDSEFRVFGDNRIVLCDFCDADFGSYLPTYFRLPESGRVIDDPHLEFVRVFPKPWVVTKDKFRPDCQRRLRFIEFRAAIMDQHRNNEPSAAQNGVTVTRFGNSGVTEEPPSVS